MSKVSIIYNHPTYKPHHSLCQLNPLSLTTHKRYRRSDSEQIENNSKLFNIIRKKNLTVEEKLEKLEKLFNKQPKPNINAQDGNDNKNTPLHLAIKRGELGIIEFILNQVADVTIKNNDGDTPLGLAKKLNHLEGISLLEPRRLAVGKSKTSEINTASEVQESIIPNDFTEGTALGEGDCFFSSIAQGMKKSSISGGSFDVKSLRNDCFEYARDKADSVYDSQTSKTWRQAIAEDAEVGGYATDGRIEQADLNSYLVRIKLTATEVEPLNLGPALWGRPEIEGRMLCHLYTIKLHVIEKHNVNNQVVPTHQLIDSEGSKSIGDDKVDALYRNDKVLHILNKGYAHFIPVLRNNPGSDTLIALPLEASPRNLDGLTASSDLSMDQEKPTNGAQGSPPPRDSQPSPGQFSHYTRTINLPDETALTSIGNHLLDPNFRILEITAQTPQEALGFMQREKFYQAFNQASHWFLIAVEVKTDGLPDGDALIALKSKFTNNKPIILQWQSPSAGQLYYRNPRGDDFSHVDLQSLPRSVLEESITKEESFTFEKLLRALKANLGGQLSDNLLTTTLDTTQEFDTWRLIDYAALYEDSLSLRWFMLTMTDKDLTQRNSGRKRALEIVAEHATPESLGALLNLPFPGTVTEEWFLSSPARELLELKDDLGNTPLMIAAKKGKVDNLQLFIRLGSDIAPHNKNSDNAITLAWKNKHYTAVKQLLEADLIFPEGFKEQDISDNELKALISDRKCFHEALKKGDKDRVEGFIRKYPRLKQAYDPSKQSALTTALKARPYEMYALLQSQGYAIGMEEEQQPEQRLTEAQKQELKIAKERYFTKPEQSHIIYLLSKSRLRVRQQDSKRFDEIKGLYESLDNIPEISTILRVIEQAKSLYITFDFNHDSIINMDPTQSDSTAAACDYRRGRIYIGAKQDKADLQGTLAHELSHLAMQIRYYNDCNPYEVLDEQKKAEFQNIVEEYQSKQEVDEVIKRVFTVYRENDWPSELIVRIPHLLAKYGAEIGEDKLKKQASSLFTWYKEQIPSDLQAFIDNPEHYKKQNQIQDLNQQLEKLDKIKELSKSIQLTDVILLSNEVTNEKQITLLSSSNPQMTLLNLYQQLAKSRTPSQLIHDVLVAQSSQFKNDLIAQNIFDAMKSPAHPWLIIDCTQDVETWKKVSSTLHSITSKQKVILIVPKTEAIEQQWREFSPRKIIDDHVYSWKDLTRPSQENILKTVVNFQGYTVELQQLMQANSPVAGALPLENLLASEKPLEIGKPVPISYGYDPEFYIDRTFNQQVTIESKIFNDIKLNKFTDFMAKSQQEFEQLCQQNPSKNVHWLQQESGEWIWQKSQGSLENLRKYIDTSQTKNYTPENLQGLIYQPHKNRFIIISDTAGMGKTTVLTHLSYKIKEQNPSHWVVKINLNDHTETLKLKQEKNEDFTLESAIEFVVDGLLNLEKESLEKQLFKHLVKEEKVVVMLDGFDEVSPNYKGTVLGLLQSLKQTSVHKLWVTTRPHLKEDLENKLQHFSYTLESFSKENQVEFITKFWGNLLQNTEINNKRTEDYAKELIAKLEISIKDKKFTGIPLQTYMLAEAFYKEFNEYCYSGKSEHNLPSKLDLLDLYEKFLDRKYLIYISEKNNPSVVNIATEELIGILKGGINLRKTYQQLAIKMLFPQQKEMLLENKKSREIQNEKLSRIGIAQKNGKIDFVHRTFAEYFAADFLVEQLKKERQPSEIFQDFVLENIFILDDYQVIRNFIDGFFKNSVFSQNILGLYGDIIHELWHGGKISTEETGTILHKASLEGNINIINFLYDSLKTGDHLETLHHIFLSFDEVNRDSSWNLAILNGDIVILNKLWSIAKEILEGRDFENLFLLENMSWDEPWHLAVKSGNPMILEEILKLAQEKLDKETVKKGILLSNSNGRSALHLAVESGNIEMINKLLEIYKRELEQKEIKTIFLQKDNYGYTAWHRAASSNSHIMEVVEKKLWECTSGMLTPIELKELLLHDDSDGYTAWHRSATGLFQKGIFEKICEQAAEKLNTIEFKELWLAEDNSDKNTVWHLVLKNENIEILEKLWKIGKEKLQTIEEIKNLLISKNQEKETIWLTSVYIGTLKSVKIFLNSIKTNLGYNEIKTVVESTNEWGNTALHLAVQNGYTDIIKFLINQGADINSGNINGWTPLHLAAQESLTDTVRLLLDKNAKINSVNDKDWTPLHLAAQNGYTDTMEILLTEDIKSGNSKTWTPLHLAAIQDKTEEIKTILKNKGEDVNVCDIKDWTPLHLASQNGYTDTVKVLLEKKANINAVSSKLLTPLHLAAQNGYTDTVKGLLEKKANVNAIDSDTCTPLHLAAQNGYTDTVKVLLEKKANVNAIDSDKRTPLHLASQNGYTDTVKVLLEKKANVNAIDSNTCTPLHLASQNGYTDTVKVLLEKKANVNTIDSDKRTPLHLASQNGYTDTVKVLLEKRQMLTQSTVINALRYT